jgi:hypothetical protein
MASIMLKTHSKFIFWSKLRSVQKKIWRPMPGLTNQDPVRDFRAGAPLIAGGCGLRHHSTNPDIGQASFRSSTAKEEECTWSENEH